MKPKNWRLFCVAVFGAGALGVVSATLLYLALFLSQQPTTSAGLFFAMFLGLSIGLGHGLLAAFGGLTARRFSDDDGWTALAAAVAVFVGWVVLAAALSGWISYLGLWAHLVVIASVATLLTAVSAFGALRRSTRRPLER